MPTYGSADTLARRYQKPRVYGSDYTQNQVRRPTAGTGRGAYGPIIAQNQPQPRRPMSFTDQSMLGRYGVNPYTTQGDMQNIWFAQGMNMDNPGPPGTPIPPWPSSGGGGRGRGGGGGGGGAGEPAMTQDTLNAMLAAIGRGPQSMGFNPIDLPDYEGTPLTPFSTQPYDVLRTNVGSAAAQDQAANTAGYDRLASTLGANFINPYTNAPVQASPQVQNAMISLMQKAGVRPGAGNDAINAENAYSRTSDEGFANLLGVLGAGAQQSQQSRMGQVAMDANTAARGIDATASGMRGAADFQQAQGQQNWQQRADDRAYQDNMMRQQLQRDEMMQNWQGQNQANQYNTTTGNEWRQNQLAPILELIAASGGSGLDLSQLMAMLQGGQ